jgi:hypothetical protein
MKFAGITLSDILEELATLIVRKLERPATTVVDRRQLAAHLGCSPRKIDAFLKEGCPSVMIGRRARRFCLEDVELWLKKRTEAKESNVMN